MEFFYQLFVCVWAGLVDSAEAGDGAEKSEEGSSVGLYYGFLGLTVMGESMPDGAHSRILASAVHDHFGIDGEHVSGIEEVSRVYHLESYEIDVILRRELAF